ncbi:MAG: cytochrome b [Rickettsiales bacterium]|jgi:cytochrome b561|nr:cytochrome b [Rickettsiales bacterium]
MEKYNPLAIIIHWFMALLIIPLLVLGFSLDALKNHVDDISLYYNLHKSFGVLVFFLVLIRLLNRLINRPPALPSNFSKNEILITKIGHFAIYVFMFVMPISGYLMSSFSSYPVSFFSITLPALESNIFLAKIFKETHEISAFAISIILAFHFLMSLKHSYLDIPEKNIFKRMWLSK